MTIATDLPPAGRPVGLAERIKEAWHGVRDPLLMNPRFQRFAARFPLTRPVARKRQRELFDLVAGFVYSQVLHAVVKTRALEAVAGRPLAPEDLARRLGLPREGARKLVAAAVSLRLLDHRAGGTVGLGDLGAALLANPGVIAMVEHHALFYADLADPVALLKDELPTTALSDYWAYAKAEKPGALDADRVADYSRLMGVSQAFVAAEILDAYPLARHRRLMDVGGGEGAFVRAAAARAGHVSFTLFDLPAVANRAADAFRQAGIAERATAVGGDLFRDELPYGADIATLVRVLYDHPRERALAILKAVRRALPDDGVLLVAEPMAGVPGAERMGAAYFGFYLTAMKGGDARTPDEIGALAREAGFSSASPHPVASPLLTSLVVCRP